MLPMTIGSVLTDHEGIDKHLKMSIHLNRGGSLEFHKNLLKEKHCLDITSEVLGCKLLRQYFHGPFQYPEPRVQLLLSSQADLSSGEIHGPGYKYHGVSMKALPLSQFPELEKLANNLASFHNLENNVWNIGAHLIVYRDSSDYIGWHADDTQMESKVFTTVLEAPVERHNLLKTSRPIVFKTKCKKPDIHRNGDEYIELFAGQGDSYSMDGMLINIRIMFSFDF